MRSALHKQFSLAMRRMRATTSGRMRGGAAASSGSATSRAGGTRLGASGEGCLA